MNCRLFLFFSSNAYTTVFTSSLRYRVTVITKAGKKKRFFWGYYDLWESFEATRRTLGKKRKQEGNNKKSKQSSKPYYLRHHHLTLTLRRTRRKGYSWCFSKRIWAKTSPHHLSLRPQDQTPHITLTLQPNADQQNILPYIVSIRIQINSYLYIYPSSRTLSVVLSLSQM